MTFVSIFLTSLMFQGQKASDFRTIDVKPAGLAVSVPKAWGQNPTDGTINASLKVPIAGSKTFGKLEIGYVNDESKDVDEFLEASKSVLTVGGNAIERQWKVDIMTSPLALTRYSKNGITTVRGVLFRPIKSKFLITVSSPTESFDKVEPTLLSTLESMKEVKVVQPKQPTIAAERKVSIQKEAPKPGKRLTVSSAVTLGSKTCLIKLPTGCRIVKSEGATVTCQVPGLVSPVVITAYSADGNPPSLIFQTKAAESSKLFAGSVQRVDQTSPNHTDKQVRDFIWRIGISEKSGRQLMTCNCVTTQANPMFLSSVYENDGLIQYAKDRKILTDFLTSVSLVEK